MSQQFFRKHLLKWSAGHKRSLPWVGEKNPYKVWLSEIILQQTRVEQGLPYYQKFIQEFPDVMKLAEAGEDRILRLWQGLGYYSRARNLHAAAKRIAFDLKGRFPYTYDEILKLKGVGEYTAAAIASFAFHEAKPVVDGNVIRVLSRFFGLKVDAYSSVGKKKFYALANKLIDVEQPGVFNQAMMDFGSQQCKPANPDCPNCPMKSKCFAFRNNQVEDLPLKKKTIVLRQRFFHYLLIGDSKRIVVRKRMGNDIWKGLYELPLVETATVRKLSSFKSLEIPLEKQELKSVSPIKMQLLSHQKIMARFYHFEPVNTKVKKMKGLVSLKNLNNFGFPKMVEMYLREQNFLPN